MSVPDEDFSSNPKFDIYAFITITSPGGLLFSEGIILLVESVSALASLIRYICYWN